jgi:ATP phosphoribosyltransferase
MKANRGEFGQGRGADFGEGCTIAPEIERCMKDARFMASEFIDPIRLALPSKGHLYEGTIELLKTAAYKVRRPSDRQYEATIAGHSRFHVVFMRPTDIVIQVQEGRCHLGVTGLDVFSEHAAEAEEAIVVMPDLGYGGCRLAVAVPESWIDVSHIMDLVDLTTEFKSAGRTFRVSTKYPALARQHFRKFGIYYYQLIQSDGALELHPSLGIADIIVDLTSSGTTLKDNRLREIDGGTVLDSAACMIGNAPSLVRLAEEGDTGPLSLLLDAIDGARNAHRWLHLEVVGGAAAGETDSANLVVNYLRNRGGLHVARGEIHDQNGRPGWRISALVQAHELTACRRALFRLGASRVVGLPSRFVYDRGMLSSYDELCAKLASRAQVDS